MRGSKMANNKISKEISKLQLDISQVTRTHSLLNQNQIQKLWNSTHQRYKYSRPAKGGGNWTYVKASYVRKVLDSVFGFNWSFDVETTLSEAFEVAQNTGYCVVKGSLIGKVKSDGEWVELKKTQFGRAEIKWKTEIVRGDNNAIVYEGDGNKRKPKKDRAKDPVTGMYIPLDFGNDMKAATSDCLKKCASLMGVAADVYEADEFQEIQIIGSDENTDRAKLTKKKIDQVKNEIKVEEVKQ